MKLEKDKCRIIYMHTYIQTHKSKIFFKYVVYIYIHIYIYIYIFGVDNIFDAEVCIYIYMYLK